MPRLPDMTVLTNPGSGSLFVGDNGVDATGVYGFDALALAIMKKDLFPYMSTNAGIGLHNSIFRGKNLGTSISSAQNTAIQNRTYDDIFVGDYWVIGGVNWRVAAVDYYYDIGDTNFNKGNVLVVPDSNLYNAPMNETNIATGGYTGSAMFLGTEITVSETNYTGLANARTTIASAFGNHVASHRIICTNATSDGKPSGWAWRDSDGIELMNETQVYGHQVWGIHDTGSAYDVGSQKTQLPLFALAPQFVNTRGTYWLQDVASATYFARVNGTGYANNNIASHALGVRPVVTLTYTS